MAALKRDRLEARRREIIAEHGEWTTHNIDLGAGVHTRGDGLYGDEFKVLRAVQLIENLVGRPWSELRIADLGCNEGLYACEFALRGATVVGIDGRRENIARAAFAKEALGLENLELLQADVRTLGREVYGGFDVVLCWGLLYHLDTPELFAFARQLREICDGIALVDTHIALEEEELRTLDLDGFWVDPSQLGPIEHRAHEGHEYRGRSYLEHPPESTMEQRLKAGWASLDNPRSFWLTKPSLVNLLVHAGFATVLEAHALRLAYPPDRLTVAALGSGDQELLAAPMASSAATVPLVERSSRIDR